MIRNKNIFWIIMGALGIFLIIAHNAALGIVCKVIGVVMVLSGILGVIGYFREKNRPGLLGSVVTALIGLWIYGNTGQFITMINVLLGVILIVSGGVSLYNKWKWGIRDFSLALPCIGIIIGIVIATSNAATSWITIAAGVGLLYSAVIGYTAGKR